MKFSSGLLGILSLLPALGLCDDVPKPTTEDDYVEAGRHIIYSYPGLDPTELLDLTKQGRVGGIILYTENIKNEQTGKSVDIASVIKSFQDNYEESPAYKTHKHPLLIMVDQEGGLVRRLPGGPEQSARDTGASEQHFLKAKEAGEEAAAALLNVKANVNLAPMVDVYREKGDFADSVGRSYSNKPDVVAGCAVSFILAQSNKKIISTAKHFPGLGAAKKGDNTDLKTVTIDTSLTNIRRIDEMPYRAAINYGVDMIMTSWAVYPALDKDYPAGMSSKVVQGELRRHLGFKGVTITDALEAASLKPIGNTGQRAHQATVAGMDLLMASQRNVQQGKDVLEALVKGLQDGSLPRDEFRKATNRILALQAKLD